MKRLLLLPILTVFYLSSFSQGQIINNTQDDPSVAISVENLTSFTLDAVFTPNADCAYYNFLLSTDAEMEQWSNMFNTPIEELVTAWCTGNIEGVYTFNYTALVPNKEYVIYARPFDSDSVAYPMDTIHVTTCGLGGSGLSTIDVEISNITDSSAVMIATPNDETGVFYDGIITKSFFDSIGVDSAVKIIQASPYPQYAVDNWNWINLDAGTAYKGIAIGKNGNEEWGEATIVDFMTLFPTGITSVDNKPVKIYPQPSNGLFVIEGGFVSGKTVKVYDIKGRLVHQTTRVDQRQEIDVRHLTDGVYFVQTEAGKSVHKMVIKK